MLCDLFEWVGKLACHTLERFKTTVYSIFRGFALMLVPLFSISIASAAQVSNGTMKDVAVIGGIATWLVGYVSNENYSSTMTSINSNRTYLASSLGKEQDSITYTSLILAKPLLSPVLKRHQWSMTAQWELSLDHWQGKSYHAEPSGYIARVMPVYRYELHDSDIIPYAEVSIGLALLSSTTIGSARKSTHLHFAEYLGFGFEMASYRVGYRFMHISNGSIVLPNKATDVHSIVVGILF